MRARAGLRIAATTMLVITALALSGCASWGLSQRAWAGSLEKLDGIESVEWKYQNNWPSSGIRYDAQIVVSPDLTPEQAAEIAAVSCAHATKITQVSLSTTEGYGENGRVDSIIAEDACIDEDALVRFAHVSSAMNELLERGYVGEFYVDGVYGPDGRLSEAPADLDGYFGLRAGASGEEMLIDALRAIHTRVSDSRLAFTGTVSESGTLLSPTENTLTARLSPDTNLDELFPFVSTLFSGWRHSVAVTDDTVAVQVSNSLNLESQQLRDLIAQGDASGIEVSATLAPFTGTETGDHSDVLADLLAVPGGVAIEASSSTSAEPQVHANSTTGARAATQIIAASDLRATFRIYDDSGLGTTLFWVAITPNAALQGERITSAFDAAIAVRNELAGVDRVILTLTQGTAKLTVILGPGAGADSETIARERLTADARGGIFDEVRLGGNNIDSVDQLIE